MNASRSPRVRREYATICSKMRRVAPPEASFEPRAYASDAITRARARWSQQLVSEHRSTFVFSALAAQMAEAGAPVDILAVVLRMAQDELRHTETCAVVVRALGGEPPVPILGTAAVLAKHPGESARQRALRNVLFTTCISEMHAVASFVAALDGMRDPYLRARVREILADEVLHGELGFAYLESQATWLVDNPSERDSLARYLRFGFAWAERELAPPAGRDVREPSADEIALGALPRSVASDLFARTMKDAVVPVFERFGIAAEDAWNRRALA